MQPELHVLRIPESRSAFTLIYTVSCAAVLCAVSAINVLGNGDDLFPSPIRPANSDRAWKARRLEQLVLAGEAPDVLILGSSRVMQLRPDYIQAITGKSCFNYAVTGGNIVDCLTQFRHAVRLGAKPDVLVLNVDEEMLLDDGATLGNLRLAGHAGLFHELPLSEKLNVVCGILGGLDIDATQRSMRALRAPATPPNDRVLSSDVYVFLADGYRINPRRAAARQQGTFDLEKEIRADLGDDLHDAGESLKGPRPTFNATKISYLRELLGLARAQDVEVYVITTPTHPLHASSKRGRIRKQLLDELRQNLQAECDSRGFIYRDFSDLASFDGDPDEFWDSTHQTPLNMQRMTDALFGLEANTVAADLPTELELLEAARLANGMP